MLVSGLAATFAAGCATPNGAEAPDSYRPNRRDYATFRSANPNVLEPNYLPFMAHRIPGDGPDGDALVFCRPAAKDMPLAVYIAPPVIPDALQDEFSPKDPSAYVAAVESALAMWERDLEGYVRFRRVTRAVDATLTLRLLGERGPEPDSGFRVLGTTPIAGACEAAGPVSGAISLDVRFRVPEVRLYIADEFGLLVDEQVEWIALHEIGHALGMRRHSPIPGDLMYEVVRNRVLVGGLSQEDINSFVSLYALPNGTVFAHVPTDDDAIESPAVDAAPVGEPQLAMAPFVDARHGFEVHPPAGWMRLETARGMVAVDGLTWDYSASFQVIVERYDTIEDYLGRFGPYYRTRGRILGWEFTDVKGYRTLEASLVTHDEISAEQLLFLEVGDGRLVVIVMECGVENAMAYWPWFHAAVGSLQVWEAPAVD